MPDNPILIRSHGRIKTTKATANSTITPSMRWIGMLTICLVAPTYQATIFTCGWHHACHNHTVNWHDLHGCNINCWNNKVKHTGSLGSSSVSLRPSHANHAKEDVEGLRSSQWCFSLSDLSLKGTATTRQLWLVVSSFPPSAHCDMWASALSGPTQNQV